MCRLSLVVAGVVAALALQPAPAANSATIRATVSGSIGTVTANDNQGPVQSGELLATVDFHPNSVPAVGRSAINIDGISAVDLAAQDGLLKAGAASTAAPPFLDGETLWSTVVTNSTSRPQLLRYDFTITPITLRLDGPLFSSAASAGSAEYEVEVQRDGLTMFYSSAALAGSYGQHTLTRNGTEFPAVLRFGSRSVRYEFAEFRGQVPLGALDPGASMTVSARLAGHAATAAQGAGAFVHIGDPLDLKNEPGVRAVTIVDDDVPVGAAASTWSTVKGLYR